jgi:hypothetical protein
MFFQDSKGRKWTFVCNTYTLARVKRETGIDLARAAEPGTKENPNTILADMIGDIASFFDVVGSLLQDDLQSENVTLRELGEAMDDEDITIEAAGALVDAVLAFSPADRSKPMRAAFDRFWTLTKKKAKLAQAEGLAELDAIDMDAAAQQVVDQMIAERETTTPLPKMPKTEPVISPAISGS